MMKKEENQQSKEILRILDDPLCSFKWPQNDKRLQFYDNPFKVIGFLGLFFLFFISKRNIIALQGFQFRPYGKLLYAYFFFIL